MTSPDPYPNLDGFLIDADPYERKETARHLDRLVAPTRNVAQLPAHEWLERYLDQYPRGPRMKPQLMKSLRLPQDTPFVAIGDIPWCSILAVVTMDKANGKSEEVLCELWWGKWRLTCCEYSFALHLMRRKAEYEQMEAEHEQMERDRIQPGLALDDGRAQVLAKFQQQMDRLPQARAWF